MSSACTHIRLGNRLYDLSQPLVMAIINVTPDSFFAASRAKSEEELRAAFLRAVSERADIIDIGACSTRQAVQSGDGLCFMCCRFHYNAAEMACQAIIPADGLW